MPSGDRTIHCVFMKNGGRLGKLMQNTFFTVQQRGEATKNRPWLIVISFKIYLESFPIQKLFNFFKFSLLYKCPKSLSKSTLMSLNWETAFKQEITKWRLRWSIRPPDVPFQLFQRLLWNHWSNHCRFLCSKTLLTYPISACTAERSFSSIAMKTIKNLQGNTMTDERLSSLSFYIHITTNLLILLTSLNLRNKLKGEAPRLVLVNIPIQLKEERQERFKSFFFNIMFYFKQASKLPKYVVVFETIWTRVHTWLYLPYKF